MRKRILLKAPVLTRSGYGEQSRYALRSLRTREDLFDIYIHPLQWGKTSWISLADEERQWIDATIEKTIAHAQQGGQFDMSLQVTIPNEWENIAPINIGYTAGIETSRVAHEWLIKGNEMDKILVISQHSKNTYKNTVYTAKHTETGQEMPLRLETPIEFINYPVKTYEDMPEVELDLEYDFNFLAVAQFGPRKNLPLTVKWFIEEFKDEEVGLVVKTNLAKNCFMDREQLFNDMKIFIKQYKNGEEMKCKVYLLHGDMTDAEMHSLYRHPQIKTLLALPHGEGFGLPIFEAAYSALPVVATGWSGQLDYLIGEDGSENFYNVAFDLQQVQDHVVWAGVLIKESLWAYPREQSAKEQMRKAYENRDSEPLVPPHIQERFEASKMHAKFVSLLDAEDDTLDLDEWLTTLEIEEHD